MRALLLFLALLAPAGRASAATAGGEATQPVPGALLYARLTTDRTDLHLQEVFSFTVSVYSRGVTMGREIALRNQDAPGLTFFPYADLGSGRETVNGKVFDVHRFRGDAQAVATGSVVLQPEVRASVVLPGGDRGVDAARGAAAVRQTELRPAGLPLKILPLPEAGKPEGFSGAVGSFTFSAAVRPAAAVVGEPVTLTMEIRGRGNLESVAAPQVAAGEQFRLYEARVLRREIGEDRVRGRVVFEQSVVPRSTSATSLPAVTFSYFDPDAGAYRRLVAGPFPLTVSPGARAAAVVVDAGPSGPARQKPALGGEIAPLKPEPRRWADAAARPWYGSAWLLALQLAPPAIVIALLLVARRREELARDEAKARRLKAPVAARSPLGAADHALRQGDAARFHDSLWEALATYFGNRLNLLPGQVSPEVVIERLSRAGLAPGDVARLGEIFRFLEQERFGRLSSANGPLSAAERDRLAGLLAELNRLVQACEQLPQ
jgi:hypothetical protein